MAEAAVSDYSSTGCVTDFFVSHLVIHVSRKAGTLRSSAFISSASS